MTVFISSLEDNITFYGASEKSLKGKLAAATMKSTQLAQSFDCNGAEVLNLQEKLAARDVVA